jgi:hypothetical protein
MSAANFRFQEQAEREAADRRDAYLLAQEERGYYRRQDERGSAGFVYATLGFAAWAALMLIADLLGWVK